MSCNSLDSGKESASDEQLLRGDESLDNSIHNSLGSVEEFGGGRGDEKVNESRSSVDVEKKKTHWKSQSVGEVGNGVSEAPTNFSQNRELWQRRAASQTHLQHQHLQVHPCEGLQKEGEQQHVTHKDIPLPALQQPSPPTAPVCSSVAQQDRLQGQPPPADEPQQPSQSQTPATGKEVWELRQKQTPDLVMDLPLVSTPDSTTEKTGGESPTGPESPDMTTAAERFAKQNQCTLKKNTKQIRNPSISDKDAQPSDTPPPLQPKPLLKAKPQLMRKPVLPSQHQISPQLIRRDTTNT